MSRWDEILNEQPSPEHAKRVRDSVLPELKAHVKEPDWWWKWLIAAVPVGAVAAGVWWIRTRSSVPERLDGDLMAMAEENFDLEDAELLSELDLLEELEVLESWNS